MPWPIAMLPGRGVAIVAAPPAAPAAPQRLPKRAAKKRPTRAFSTLRLVDEFGTTASFRELMSSYNLSKLQRFCQGAGGWALAISAAAAARPLPAHCRAPVSLGKRRGIRRGLREACHQAHQELEVGACEITEYLVIDPAYHRHHVLEKLEAALREL